MKHWKKAAISAIVVSAAAISGLAMNALADSREEREIEDLKAAFVGAEETLLDMSAVTFPAAEETGTTAGMTEQELDACVADYTARIERYYSDSHPSKQQYIAQHEALVRDALQTEVSYLVDGGVLDCELNNVEISDDGNTATFDAYWIDWNNWAEQAEDGSYEVTAPIGDNSAAITMVKEGGCWKLLKTENYRMGYADEAIDEISGAKASMAADEADSVTAAFEKAQEICQTSYDTFDEALAAAKTIDADKINPYPILEKVTANNG